ncbi:MAG: preprotein translocase subunit SecE [Desulfarculaceae bacterium]|jgi:preprotein translocase subunit SecE
MAAKKPKKISKPRQPFDRKKPVKAVQAKPVVKAAPAKGPARWWEASVQFLREVKTELKKVTWPSRKQTISSTGVVLILVFIVAAFLGLVDMILSKLVDLVVS